jgi:hypothetical protein
MYSRTAAELHGARLRRLGGRYPAGERGHVGVARNGRGGPGEVVVRTWRTGSDGVNPMSLRAWWKQAIARRSMSSCGPPLPLCILTIAVRSSSRGFRSGDRGRSSAAERRTSSTAALSPAAPTAAHGHNPVVTVDRGRRTTFRLRRAVGVQDTTCHVPTRGDGLVQRVDRLPVAPMTELAEGRGRSMGRGDAVEQDRREADIAFRPVELATSALSWAVDALVVLPSEPHACVPRPSAACVCRVHVPGVCRVRLSRESAGLAWLPVGGPLPREL